MSKMVDLGMKREKAMPTEAEKNKIIYPSFSVEKNMGMKMGD